MNINAQALTTEELNDVVANNEIIILGIITETDSDFCCASVSVIDPLQESTSPITAGDVKDANLLQDEEYME